MSVGRSRLLINSAAAGQELDYKAFTANVTINATSEGAANTVITSNSITVDGSTKIGIQFHASAYHNSGGQNIYLVLVEDTTVIAGIWSTHFDASRIPADPTYYRTPSAGTHTYTVKGWTDSGTGTVYANVGTAGNYGNGFLRITRESSVLGANGIAGIQGGFAPLDSSILIPASYLPTGTNGMALCTADQNAGTGGSFTDIPGLSQSLTAGTYLINWRLLFTSANNRSLYVKLWNGTTLYDEAEDYVSGGFRTSVCGHTIVTLASTTTVKISASTDAATTTVKRDGGNSTDHHPSKMAWVRIA